MAKLRAAILGAGLISGKKHIPAFLRQRSRAELVALCDVNLQAAETLGKPWGIPRFYSSLGELLAKEKPDLVDICTPPRTHAKLAIEAIRHGCNVLIEKPMATTVAECDEIIQAAREANVKVCVAHSGLFQPTLIKARELVAAGRIGEVRGLRILLSTPTDYMTSRQDHWAHRLPGGVLGETAPHIIYITLAFINPVRNVAIQAKKLLDYPWSAYEDYRIELMGDKAMSSVVLTYTSDQWMGSVDILGSHGGLLLDLQGQSVVCYNRPALTPLGIARSMLSGTWQTFLSTCANGLRLATGRLRNPHEIIVEGFLRSLLENGPIPATAEEGREAVRVMDMLVEELGALPLGPEGGVPRPNHQQKAGSPLAASAGPDRVPCLESERGAP
jgi:predicted dehydrogenase